MVTYQFLQTLVSFCLENKNKRQKNATCCFYYFMLKVNLCTYATYISYDIARTTRHAFLVGIVIDVNRIDDFYGMGANSIFWYSMIWNILLSHVNDFNIFNALCITIFFLCNLIFITTVSSSDRCVCSWILDYIHS